MNLTIAIGVGLLALIGSAIGLAVAQSFEPVEVRVAARAHENGTIEFGVQPRDGDEWGSLVSPRARFLPSDPPVGRWLYSSLVTIGDKRIASGVVPFPVPDGAVEISGVNADGIEFEIVHDSLAGTTRTTVFAKEDNTYGLGLRLELSCVPDVGLEIKLANTNLWSSQDTQVTWRIDQNLTRTELWNADGFNDFISPNAQSLISELEDARRITFQIAGADGSNTIPVLGILETAAQPNLDRCGTY